MIPDRIKTNIQPVPGSDCLTWTGARTGRGLPVVKHDGRVRSVWRVLRAIEDPTFDPATERRHSVKCGTQDCVNWRHHVPGVNRPAHFGDGKCLRGLHDVTQPGSIRVTAKGHRRCRECILESNRRNAPDQEVQREQWRAAQRARRARLKAQAQA